VQELIEKNKGLVWKQIHRLHLQHDSEAESLGFEALWKAAETFKNEKGIQFSTYATVCIYNALGSYIRTLNTKNKIEFVSYHNTTQEGSEYIDSIATGQSPEDMMTSEERLKHMYSIFEEQSLLLNDKQRAIIDNWRESDFTAQTTEIAKVVGVSQSYVSSTLAVFKNRLRIEFELEEIIDV